MVKVYGIRPCQGNSKLSLVYGISPCQAKKMENYNGNVVPPPLTPQKTKTYHPGTKEHLSSCF